MGHKAGRQVALHGISSFVRRSAEDSAGDFLVLCLFLSHQSMCFPIIAHCHHNGHQFCSN